MKFRLVKFSGLNSKGESLVAFSVEYKKYFFSRWKSYYKSEWVYPDMKYKTVPILDNCRNLLSALKERNATTIKTVLE
ncbi:tail fibers protein [Escherichia phage vB_EcoM_FB]|nr:tail fibers protein [Escherichia phage vB_EcoM_FB]